LLRVGHFGVILFLHADEPMQRSLTVLAQTGKRLAPLPRRIGLQTTPVRGTAFPQRLQSSTLEPWDLFHVLDMNKSGRVCMTDYEKAIETLSDVDVRKYCKLAFLALDTNRDGVVCKEEFGRAVASLSTEELDFLRKGISRNELSDTAETDDAPADTSLGSRLVNRFSKTCEVCVSKIFPAGFGWQASSLAAGAAGLEATDVAFFLCTGVGDALGVGIGHMAWHAGKRGLGYDVDITTESHTATLLMTACMFSGTAWQPLVNLLHMANFTFAPAAAGTMMGCGLAFFVGLRFGRIFWSPRLRGVAAPSYANLKADAQLSMAVGGATGAFVGTDVGFVDPTTGVDTNVLRPIVGVEETVGDLHGCVLAGTSTAIGFTAVQSAQNVALAPGKNWVD